MGSSHGQQTIQGACVSETAVHDHGRRLNKREFRPMAEIPFRAARQLSEYKGKGASASGEPSLKWLKKFITPPSNKNTFNRPLVLELVQIKHSKGLSCTDCMNKSDSITHITESTRFWKNLNFLAHQKMTVRYLPAACFQLFKSLRLKLTV